MAYKVDKLASRHPATIIAVITAFILAFYNGSGTGAMILWPLFGTANQLLGALALLVITVYLVKKKVPYWYTAIPMIFMVIMTFWAMLLNLGQYVRSGNWLLFIIGGIILVLEIWMLIETIIIFSKGISSGQDVPTTGPSPEATR